MPKAPPGRMQQLEEEHKEILEHADFKAVLHSDDQYLIAT